MDNESVRTVKALQIKEPINSNRPFSNFAFIDKYFKGCRTLRRILSQVRLLKCQTLIIEIIDDSIDIIEENEDIKSLCPGFNPNKVRTYRLSFFSTLIKTIKEIDSVENRHFLGYAILRDYVIPATKGVLDKNIDKFSIYESVLKTYRHDNNFIKNAPLWKCRVGNKLFSVSGHIYAQQNGINNSCSHVALRAVAGIFTKSDISYRYINDLVKKYRREYTKPEKLPGKGLTNEEICHVLKNIGANYFEGDLSKQKQKKSNFPYQKYLYGAIESGFPAILFFGFGKKSETDQRNEASYHVIPIFGHTFNEDTWVPDANIMYFPFRTKTKILSSYNWVSMFIGHDDNAGSNYCIPQNYLEPMRLCPKEQNDELCDLQKSFVAYAIGTIPANIKVDPIEAEIVAAELIPPVLDNAPKKYCPWQSRLKEYLDLKQLVLRPSLITGKQYQNHLRKVTGWDYTKIPEAMINTLKIFSEDNLWMVELSVPELFSANKRKIGEVLIRANKELQDDHKFESFCYARIPGCSAFLLKIVNKQPTFLYFPNAISDHVELFGSEEKK